MFLDVRDLTITLKTGEEIAKDISFSGNGAEMQRNTGYFPTESLEPSGNRLFSRSALNEGYLFRGSLIIPFQVRCFIGGKTCCTVQRNDCRQSTVKKYAILCKTP